jgi:hypothetical protein
MAPVRTPPRELTRNEVVLITSVLPEREDDAGGWAVEVASRVATYMRAGERLTSFEYQGIWGMCRATFSSPTATEGKKKERTTRQVEVSCPCGVRPLALPSSAESDTAAIAAGACSLRWVDGSRIAGTE